MKCPITAAGTGCNVLMVVGLCKGALFCLYVKADILQTIFLKNIYTCINVYFAGINANLAAQCSSDMDAFIAEVNQHPLLGPGNIDFKVCLFSHGQSGKE